MTKTTLMEKYPVLSLEISKNDINYKNVPEILEYFKTKIDADKVAKCIGIFNHYEHTQSLEDDDSIAEGILDAQNIMFCFGKKIPNVQILAVRPRSIAVVEYEDKFAISFMETPMPPMTDKIIVWVKELSK
jgi:hypothetical protein